MFAREWAVGLDTSVASGVITFLGRKECIESLGRLMGTVK